MARLSYEPEKTIKKILNDTWNIKLGSCTSIDNLPIIDPNAKWLDNYNFFYYHNTSYARAFILATKKSIVVVFRGTEPFNMFEWFTDSLFKMRPLGTTSLIQYQHVLNEDLNVSMAHRGFLDALEVLHNKGVEISACGTCINFYQLKDKLKIGTITNMVEVVESLSTADKVISL